MTDAKRLDAIEEYLFFVEPDYSRIPATYCVGKAGQMFVGATIREAIDKAIAARTAQKGP